MYQGQYIYHLLFSFTLPMIIDPPLARVVTRAAAYISPSDRPFRGVILVTVLLPPHPTPCGQGRIPPLDFLRRPGSKSSGCWPKGNECPLRKAVCGGVDVFYVVNNNARWWGIHVYTFSYTVVVNVRSKDSVVNKIRVQHNHPKTATMYLLCR